MSNRATVLSGLALMALAGSVHAQCDTAKLAAGVPAADDWYGSALAIKGGTLVVGTKLAEANGHAEQGSVEVYSNVFGWVRTATLQRNSGAAGDWFGSAVDVSGDWIISGMPLWGLGTGGASFYQRTGNQWIERTVMGLPVGQENAHAGYSVAIDGDYAIFGAPDSDSVGGHVNFGNAVVAVRVGDFWQYVALIYTNPVADFDNTGASVGVRGDLFMTGVPGRTVNGNAGAGAVGLTHPNQASQWQQDQLVTATDPQAGAHLGRSAALGDDILVAGAPDYDNGITTDSGAVYVFEPGQFGIWGQTAKISPPSPTPGAHFGGRVAIDGSRIVIVEYGTGKTYVYRRTTLGGWVEEWRLHDPESLGQGFGGSAAVWGNKVAVSSILGEVNGVNAAGYVNVFDMTGAFGSNAKAFAPTIAAGSYSGCTQFATDDGSTSCGNSNTSPDVWFRFTALCSGNTVFNTFGSNFDTVLSVHSSSLSGPGATLACNDNAGQFFETSSVTLSMTQGQEVYIRIAGNDNSSGNYTLNIQACGPASCYANCDASTAAPILNANDFQCFLNKFASSDPYANCDHSTSNPLLTANDFQCFLNAFAAGCT